MHRCVPLVLHILVAVFCILCGFYPCLTEIKSFIHSFIHSSTVVVLATRVRIVQDSLWAMMNVHLSPKEMNKIK